MDNFQLFIVLMAVAFLLVGVAQKFKFPYPIALVLGGALLGFMPGVSAISFDPNLLLVVVLPPLLHFSAVWISFRDFKKYKNDIFSLALGLVIATTLVVGVVFKWLFPDAPWALAFTFGAIISPPDAVSATTVLKRFNISTSLMSVLEGESLINDAVALVIYKLSVAALLTGSFSLTEASIEFVQISIGGIAVGAVVGYALQQFVRRFLTPVVAVMFSLILPYIVYILATALGVSGVLAVVTSGLITSCFLVRHYDSFRRVLAVSTWSIFIILLNCFVFILIGLQLKEISERLGPEEMYKYSGYALLFTAIMFLIRLLWVTAKHAYCFIRACEASYAEYLREGAILSWCGMRGIISLACAIALPLNLEGRDVVIFITFEVILLTLVVPGFTLPILLKWLKLHERVEAISVSHIRKQLLDAAEREIMKLLHLNNEEREFLRNYINTRYHAHEISTSKKEDHARLEEARRKLLQAERNHLLKLWEQGEIDDTLLKHLEIELDLEEHLTVRAEIH